jgi:hypothetical protein
LCSSRKLLFGIPQVPANILKDKRQSLVQRIALVPAVLGFERGQLSDYAFCKVVLFYLQASDPALQRGMFEHSEAIHVLLLKNTFRTFNIAAFTQLDKPVQENNIVSGSSIHSSHARGAYGREW